MKPSVLTKLLLIWLFAFPIIVHSQVSNDSVVLINDLSAFNNPEKTWSTVADVTMSPVKNTSLKKTTGNGIILADAGKTETYLTTQTVFGDVEVEFDFLVGRGSLSAVLLHGRYRLNLSDSWAQLTPSSKNMGGIGQQNLQDFSSFSGGVPLMNIAKAPGLWQHARLRFRSPQFTNGAKTTNAVFEEVYINGCLVQQNMELQGPSAGATLTTEAATGPVVFYAGNGAFALKNLVIRKLAAANNRPQAGRRFRTVNPIVITPEGSNYFLRSFLNFGRKKKTHTISVGTPKEVNYSYDMKQGALLQVWNGPFVDVTEMWEQRGEPQLAKPLGSVIILSEAPALAMLADANVAWPDSVGFDDFRNMGYTLDKQRNATYEYETGGYHVWDKISLGAEDRSLIREINVTKAPANLFLRVANASAISLLGDGLYVIGDKTYYIQVDEKLKPFIRNTSQGSELIVPVADNKPVSYSLIW